jgi:hypothetical protein
MPGMVKTFKCCFSGFLSQLIAENLLLGAKRTAKIGNDV